MFMRPSGCREQDQLPLRLALFQSTLRLGRAGQRKRLPHDAQSRPAATQSWSSRRAVSHRSGDRRPARRVIHAAAPFGIGKGDTDGLEANEDLARPRLRCGTAAEGEDAGVTQGVYDDHSHAAIVSQAEWA
jgi:hypothetical protein